MQTLRPVRRRLSAAALAIALTSLSACGFDYPTDQVYTPGVGTNDRSGEVEVLHAVVVSDAPGSGVFIAGLANNNDSEDQALVTLAGAEGEAGVQAAPQDPVIVPAGGFVQLADEGGIAVSGDRIASGNAVEMVIGFDNGQLVTMWVPVVTNEGDFADVEIPSAP